MNARISVFVDQQSLPVTFRHQYLGACMALTDARIGYRVLFLGDGEVCPTRTTLDDFRGLKVVVAPNCYAMTDENLRLLRDYVQAGGKVIATGRFAIADGMNRPRGVGRPAALLSGLTTAEQLLLENPVFKPEEGVMEPFAARLRQAGVTPAVAVEPADTRIEIQQRLSASGDLLVDLLNRNWVSGKGFADLANATVTVRLPPAFQGRKLQVRLARPEFADGAFESLDARPAGADRLAFTVPELAVYGLAVVTAIK